MNRELEGLRRAYSWSARQQPPLVASVLSVEFFPEDNARQGFFERADFEALLAHVQDVDLRDFIEWGFWTGMRAGEIGKLTWAMLDRETWTLRLHATAAKIGRGRVLVLAGPLRAIIERRLQARRLDCSLIFHRRAKGKPGQPVKDFRRAWASACEAVGLPAGRKAGFTFHDTRRTAVRNLIRAGVDQTVAMKISGHETTSTFRRYNITSEEDLRAAVEKVAAYVDTLPAERKVVGLGEGKSAALGQPVCPDRPRPAVPPADVGARSARPARAHSLRVVEAFDGAALLRVSLHTGRTHQIRMHLASLGHPVAGDEVYGGRRTPASRRAREALGSLERPALHAARLAFEHPTRHERLAFGSPLPEDIAGVLQRLRG